MEALIIILSHLLVVGFAYWVFRIKVRKDYLTRQQLSWISILLEVLVFALFANLIYFFFPTSWPEIPPVGEGTAGWVGLLLVILGFVATIWAMAMLGIRRLFGQYSFALVQSGWYRYTRNPQIVAFSVMLVGAVLLWPSWWAVLWLPTYCVLAHLMVITEEEFLVKVHGEEYEEYCKKVPRYF